MQNLCHRGTGHIGTLFWQAGIGQITAGVFRVSHIHVRDDIHDAAVRLLRQALILAAVSCLHVEDGNVQTLCADDAPTAFM